MANGTIKTITERGFGFIQPEDAQEDIFFHQSSLVDVSMDQLRTGDHVTFNVEKDPRGKGPRASDVHVSNT